MNDHARAWLAKAQADLLNIHNNLAATRTPWDTVAFHAQQAAEKSLKALLVRRGLVPARTHDLVRLVEECVAAGWPVQPLRASAAMLLPYSTASRYPGVSIEPTPDEARAAASAAEDVFTLARALIEAQIASGPPDAGASGGAATTGG